MEDTTATCPMFWLILLVGAWGPRFSCSYCGWEGEWHGSTCPRCGK